MAFSRFREIAFDGFCCPKIAPLQRCLPGHEFASIEFIKELCQIARETLVAEREITSPQQRKSATAALTELFLETRTDQTPAAVERIVNDMDAIVQFVRFPGWQSSVAGKREVQKSLRKTLLKYQLHKEEELFEKAYGYIKAYY